MPSEILVPSIEALLDCRVPRWDGKKVEKLVFDLTGGLGDFVLFSRLTKIAVLDRGIPVFFTYGYGAPPESKKELLELFCRQPWCNSELVSHGDLEQVRNGSGSISACVDYEGLLSLFPFRAETFAMDYPPLRWEAEPNKNIEVIVRGDGTNVAIGLCTTTGKIMPEGVRSLFPFQIERLVRSVPDVRWINLHPIPLDLPGVINFRGTIAELASAISVCDAVLSVDTFHAHLAASLGKRTYTLLPGRPTWFWAFDWYPNMELIRSHGSGLTDDGIDQAVEVLYRLR